MLENYKLAYAYLSKKLGQDLLDRLIASELIRPQTLFSLECYLLFIQAKEQNPSLSARSIVSIVCAEHDRGEATIWRSKARWEGVLSIIDGINE